ncbi:hypothetical protein [Microtetraspora sp. AC03309]|nr:hypothetical protein [Microtetraspora sp. AC03309]
MRKLRPVSTLALAMALPGFFVLPTDVAEGIRWDNHRGPLPGDD